MQKQCHAKTECAATAAKPGNSVPDSIVFQRKVEAREDAIMGLGLQCRKNTGCSSTFLKGK